MILYVVTREYDEYENLSVHMPVRNRLEAIAGDYCHVLHHSHLSTLLLAELRPWAICHSGGRHRSALHAQRYQECIKNWNVAQIGFCGGHQLIARMFGSVVGPISPADQDKVNLNRSASFDQVKEQGWCQVTSVVGDRLLANLPPTMTVWQNHWYHIVDLGPDLIALAKSEACPVEMWAHRSLPLYGVQFHPEVHDADHADGLRLLENFFGLARDYYGQKRVMPPSSTA